MKNLTLAIDENMLREARKLALERDTTVNAMVREFLYSIVENSIHQRPAFNRLVKKINKGILEVGKRDWTRDELYR
ncbi:hypothetical protein K8T06_04405 [bacterium]|nr:hypothetical protein [bacterium]